VNVDVVLKPEGLTSHQRRKKGDVPGAFDRVAVLTALFVFEWYLHRFGDWNMKNFALSENGNGG
jgi:hypothetical protein